MKPHIGIPNEDPLPPTDIEASLKWLKDLGGVALVMLAAIILLCLFLSSCQPPAYASINPIYKEYTDEQLANAIYKAEGGIKAVRAGHAYGIRSVRYGSLQEARRICIRTIQNNLRRYKQYGYKQYPSYLEFLQSRYCPTVSAHLSLSEKRLNKNWLTNVKHFLEVNNG